MNIIKHQPNYLVNTHTNGSDTLLATVRERTYVYKAELDDAEAAASHLAAAAAATDAAAAPDNFFSFSLTGAFTS